MRVNVYAEEMTQRVEIISKVVEGAAFTGLRFYLELPVTVGGSGSQHRSIEGPLVFPPVTGEIAQIAGPFVHRPGDDDSSAVTFWGKRDLRLLLRRALAMLDEHYEGTIPAEAGEGERCDESFAGSSGTTGSPPTGMETSPTERHQSSTRSGLEGSTSAPDAPKKPSLSKMESSATVRSSASLSAIVERISTEVAEREMGPDYGLVGYGTVVSIAREVALRCVEAVLEERKS
jgi:hypothetical protein